ncbi:hypothetical protein BG616_20020 [Bacillus subtilis]|nr:hypothetical protein BG616_20020 [Bacillus subtilis]
MTSCSHKRKQPSPLGKAVFLRDKFLEAKSYKKSHTSDKIKVVESQKESDEKAKACNVNLT